MNLNWFPIFNKHGLHRKTQKSGLKTSILQLIWELIILIIYSCFILKKHSVLHANILIQISKKVLYILLLSQYTNKISNLVGFCYYNTVVVSLYL